MAAPSQPGCGGVEDLLYLLFAHRSCAVEIDPNRAQTRQIPLQNYLLIRMMSLVLSSLK
jgi:hypothetical protein